MPPQEGNSGHAVMRPRARLISLLGDELISDEAVALVELVKNAYDADATKVEIDFIIEDNKLKEIEVHDNGHGMTLDDVLKGWFEPGTIRKKKNPRSPKERTYQGAKGIGRFASARLSPYLLIETSPDNGDDSVSALINWGSFDDDSYLDEIEIDYQTKKNNGTHGTSLFLSGIEKPWKEENFQAVHNRLARLVNPIGEESGRHSDFSITLNIPGHPEFSGEIEAHPLTQKPIYLLKGKINSDGQLSGSLSYHGKVVQEITNRKLDPDNGEKTPGCGPISIEIRAWDRDRESLDPYASEYQVNITQIRKTLDRYCGVSLYRDGFRVYPYGEPGNDWLQLDLRSRLNPSMRLSNNQVIAAIKTSRMENPGLRDRSTREGLVHTDELNSLKEWFISALKIIEEDRYKRKPRPKKREVLTIFEAFDISDLSKAATKSLGKNHPVARMTREKDKEISSALKKLQDHYSRFMMTAGFGQLVDLAIHEIGAPLGRADRELFTLTAIVDELPKSQEKDAILKKLENLKNFLDQIGQRRDALIPKTAGRRGRASKFLVEEEIEGNVGLFEGILRRQKIHISISSPSGGTEVFMSRNALGQVISNLLDNAIYWVSKKHGAGKGGEIKFTIDHLDEGFQISVSDNGPGIEGEDKESIFSMNFSKKPNGMGLGLYVAREVISPYGKIVLDEDSELGGAQFRAIFERGVGR